MSRSKTDYVVIALLDPEYRGKILLWGLVCVGSYVPVLTLLFTDLFQGLALGSPSASMRRWGPVVVGFAGASLVTLAGIAAGAPTSTGRAQAQPKWWRTRKVWVSAMITCLGVAIAYARFSKGVAAIRAQRRAAIAEARADLAAARKTLTESAEAKSILASIQKADDLIALGTRKRFPKIRQHGFRLREEARKAQSELKATANADIQEAQARLKALPPSHELPMGEVLRAIAGPALTELAFAEVGVLVMAFWAGVAGAPIRRRRWADLEAEYAAERARVRWEQSPPPRPPVTLGSEPSIQDDDIEDVEFEEPVFLDESDQQTSARHRSLRGVHYEDLDAKTVEGLNALRGEWYVLPLGMPALRRVGTRMIRWPTINIDDGARTIFAGSKEAFALLPQKMRALLQDRFDGHPDHAHRANGESPRPVSEVLLAAQNNEEPN